MPLFILGLLVLAAGCGPGESEPPTAPSRPVNPGRLLQLRVFFGHQSVGRDVLAGLADVAPEIEIAPATGAPPGPALLEASLGQNGNPATKDRAFLETVTRLGALDLALYKYCYLDVGPDTEPATLFAAYARTLDASPVRTIAITVPLTAPEPGWKRWLKQLAGRPTQAMLNARRMEFNELLRRRGDAVPLIDLARMQSTLEDGSRCLTRVEGVDVECLAPEFTDDGAHLNERGRRHVARGFVERLERAAGPP